MKLKRRERALGLFETLSRHDRSTLRFALGAMLNDRYPGARIAITLHNTRLRSVTSRLLVHTCPEVRSPAACEFSGGKPELFSDAN